MAAATTAAGDTMAAAIMVEVEATTEVVVMAAAISMTVMATTGIIRTVAASGTAPGTRTA